jgi:hypothetical protein
MFKRKSQIFCIAAVAIVCLFMSTDVFATWYRCTDEDYGLVEVTGPGPDYEFPVVIADPNDPLPPDMPPGVLTACGGEFPCTVFAYKYKNDKCKFLHMAQALPDPENYCPEGDKWLIKNEVDSDWKDAGEGGSWQTSYWYKGDSSVRVLQSDWVGEDGFFIITSNNVSAHPAPFLGMVGLLSKNRTVLAPNCSGKEPVELSSVSTSTPEGCTLTVGQTLTGPVAEYICPGDTESTPANEYDTDEVYLGTPLEGTCEDGKVVEILGKEICMQAFKFISNQAYGRVGQESTGWYYWNGKWYSYTY